MATKRKFETLKRQILRAFERLDPIYDSLMDEATVVLSEEQWQELCTALDERKPVATSADRIRVNVQRRA